MFLNWMNAKTAKRRRPEMKASELKAGRTFGVTFQHGDDFMASLACFCRQNEVRQGYIPMFIAGFAEADIVGTCEKLEDPLAPVWAKVHVTNVEALGCGTIAHDDADGTLPHVHVAVGLKEHSATAHASHLLSAKVQFLTEMLVVEILAPDMTRPKDRSLYDVPLLTFK
jgi:predicted DNA-binding protein with PD1-like motif